MGCSAFFIRMFGCPVHCSWCDSAGTWHKDWIPKAVDRIPAEDLAKEAIAANPEIIVITGGEPTIHDLAPLSQAIRQRSNVPIHLETCGAFKFEFADLDWITLSPKWAAPPQQGLLDYVDEVKIIVEDRASVETWLAKLGQIEEQDIDSILDYHRMESVTWWLHPEWSQRNNKDILNTISKWVKDYGPPFRAGYQLHKLYNVDAIDERSQMPVPLGGKINEV